MVESYTEKKETEETSIRKEKRKNTGRDMGIGEGGKQHC